MLRLMGRIAGLFLAGAGLWWVAVLLPVLERPREGELTQVGRRVAALQFFPPEILQALDDETLSAAQARPCRPTEREGRTLIRVELSAPYLPVPEGQGDEDPAAGASRGEAASPTPAKEDGTTDAERQEKLAQHMETVREAAYMTLRCDPYSTLTWVVLAFAEAMTTKDPDRILTFIDMSDRTGPREKLALLRRLELTLPLFDRLNDQQKARFGEQIRALADERPPFGIALFHSESSPEIRAFIEEELGKLDEQRQKRVATYIRRLGGYIDLPLVEPEGQRPWR